MDNIDKERNEYEGESEILFSLKFESLQSSRPGHWDEEPDFVLFRYKSRVCLIMRNNILGFLTGYVLLTEEESLKPREFYSTSIDVHGGVTYYDFLYQNRFIQIKEVKEILEKYPTKWIGFDCAHHGDLLPYDPPDLFIFSKFTDSYKSLKFVIIELICLVDQLNSLC